MLVPSTSSTAANHDTLGRGVERPKRYRLHYTALVAHLLLGCGQATHDSVPASGDTSADTHVTTSSAPVVSDAGTTGASEPTTTTNADAGAPETERCRAAPGTTGAPTTVVEVVQLINGLPHPVTLTCLLEALDRPLRILAASSFISAQPAFNVDNPRIFILGDGISLSVVPYGDSRDLLEMGELTSNTRSIKAELEFPILEQLPLDAAFAHVRSEAYGGTVCFGCHHGEVEVDDYGVPGAFESVAYRPLPEYEVNFDYVEYQFTTCDETLEPERCAFYTALFGHGEVRPDHFPEEMPLFQ